MSTTASPQADYRTLPRKKRPPGQRDQGIYLQYLDGRTQEELAEQHHVSQSRISQIVRRVERWRANLRPQEEGELSHEERQRLERWRARRLQEGIYARAIRRFDAPPQVLITTKEATRDGKTYHEETQRQLATPAGLLRIAQRAAEKLEEQADKEPLPGEEADPRQARWEAGGLLQTLRRAAEESGRVPQSNDFNYVTAVNYCLSALLGENVDDLPDADELTAGHPLTALLSFYRRQKVADRRVRVRIGDTTAQRAAEADAAEVAALRGLVTGGPVTGEPTASNTSTASDAHVDGEPQVPGQSQVASEGAAENGEAHTADAHTAGVAVVGAAAHSEAAAGTAETGAADWSPLTAEQVTFRVEVLQGLRQGLTKYIEENPECSQVARRRLAEVEAELQPLLARVAVVGAAAHSAAALASVVGEASHSQPQTPYQRALHKAAEAILKAEREAAEKAERRRLHMEKLERWREAQRRGSCEMFVFDPEDGPLPPVGGRYW